MTDATYFTTVPSLIGALTLTHDGEALTGLRIGASPIASSWRRDAAPFAEVLAQLEQYWARERTAFDLPLAPKGTAFQLRVWEALRAIPYGQTASYGEIARRIGRPAACRAVGGANNRNPIPVIVPCHRVIGSSGKLVGYGSGLGCKQTLLDLEAGAGT